MDKNQESDGGVRFDKWLWAARFFKTRALATQAINAGKVKVNGLRIKSSKKVPIGATVTIHRGVEAIEVVVQAVSGRRGSAQVAMLLYEETQASIQHRQSQQETKKILGQLMPNSPAKRPNKKQRRDLLRLKNKE